jgi:hypothetical protein
MACDVKKNLTESDASQLAVSKFYSPQLVHLSSRSVILKRFKRKRRYLYKTGFKHTKYNLSSFCMQFVSRRPKFQSD